MPDWIQIRVVSEDDAPAEETPVSSESGAGETTTLGAGTALAFGGALLVLALAVFAGWYFGFRGSGQPASTAAVQPPGEAVPMPASQFSSDQGGIANQQPANATSAGGSTSTSGAEALALSEDSKRRLSSDKQVAVINGEPITEALLEREVGIARVLYSLRGNVPLGNDAETLERMRTDLLGAVIDEQLVLQAAQEAGIEIDDAAVDQRVEDVLTQAGLSREEMAERLAAVGVSVEELRESLWTTMMTERFAEQNPPPEDVTAKSDYAAWVKVLQKEGDIEILVEGESAKVVKAGQPAPDFTLRNPEGETVSLSDFAGHPLLINFWATWCPPCRFEMPLFQQTYEKLKDDGFVVLAVDVQEGPEEVKEYIQEMGLTFPVVLDRSGSVSNTYRVTGLPTSVFVDADGIVTNIHRGAVIEGMLDRYLDEILEQ